jgi:hypothetical protein
LRLESSGQIQLNPLARIGSAEPRDALLHPVARAVLSRPLHEYEAVGLRAALSVVDARARGGEVCIPHVVAVLRDPSEHTAGDMNVPARRACYELRDCSLALHRLCFGPVARRVRRPNERAGAQLPQLPLPRLLDRRRDRDPSFIGQTYRWPHASDQWARWHLEHMLEQVGPYPEELESTLAVEPATEATPAQSAPPRRAETADAARPLSASARREVRVDIEDSAPAPNLAARTQPPRAFASSRSLTASTRWGRSRH